MTKQYSWQKSTKRFTKVLLPGLLLLASCGSSSMSAEKLRTKFISAGGTCSVEVSSESTTTSTSASSIETSISVLEYHDCGEDEASMSRYETQTAVLQSRLYVDGLTWGFSKSTGSDLDLFLNPKVIVDTWSISISDAEVAIAASLASKLGGTVFDFNDSATRAKVLQEITNGDPIVALEKVAKGCGAAEQLSSDGQSISFDTKGKDDSDGDGMYSAFCALRILGAADFVFEAILTTRALDGRVEESWDKFSASWTYHPDSGMRLTVVAEKQ